MATGDKIIIASEGMVNDKAGILQGNIDTVMSDLVDTNANLATTDSNLTDTNTTLQNTIVNVSTNTNNIGLFAGFVLPFINVTIPDGFLECNGQEVSRTTYSVLYSLTGDTYGAGDGSTTFNLPDLRGEFIRGLDAGRGVDTGRTIGTSQADKYKSHNHSASGSFSGTAASHDHSLNNHNHSAGNHRHTYDTQTHWTKENADNSSSGFYYGVSGRSYRWSGYTNMTTSSNHSGVYSKSITPSGSVSVSTSNSGSNETAPRNISMVYCIKY